MAKNQVQLQKGFSLSDFLHQYGSEEQCREALFRWRWPEGFSCPVCSHGRYHEITSRRLYQCSHCHHQTSLTSVTIFDQSKNGVSALAMRRQLGISDNATWRLKQKLMQVMKERDDGQPLTGVVQLDDAYWGAEQGPFRRRGGHQ